MSDLVVELTENDVPGAKLRFENIDEHSVAELKRWLLCHDIKVSGRKDELVRR